MSSSRKLKQLSKVDSSNAYLLFQIGHKQNHWLFHLIWEKFNRFIDLQRWVHTATPCFDGTSYPGMTQLVKCHCHGSTQLGFHERLQRPQSHVDLGISLYDSKRCREIRELRLPSKTKKHKCSAHKWHQIFYPIRVT